MPKKVAAVVADHPPFNTMVRDAIKADKSRKGTSRQAILKYIMANYKVGTDPVKVNKMMRNKIRKMLESGVLQLQSGSGLAGRYRIEPVTQTKEAKPNKKKTKPVVKKVEKKTKVKAAGVAKAKKTPTKKSASKKIVKEPAKRKPVKKSSKSPINKLKKVKRSVSTRKATRAAVQAAPAKH